MEIAGVSPVMSGVSTLNTRIAEPLNDLLCAFGDCRMLKNKYFPGELSRTSVAQEGVNGDVT